MMYVDWHAASRLGLTLQVVAVDDGETLRGASMGLFAFTPGQHKLHVRLFRAQMVSGSVLSGGLAQTTRWDSEITMDAEAGKLYTLCVENRRLVLRTAGLFVDKKAAPDVWKAFLAKPCL